MHSNRNSIPIFMNFEAIVSISFDVLAIILSIAFVILMLRSKRSLQGSFFAHYYHAMTAAAVSLMFGFIIEPLGMYIIPFDPFWVELLHHMGLITASFLFVYSSYILPKDAATYLQSQHSNG